MRFHYLLLLLAFCCQSAEAFAQSEEFRLSDYTKVPFTRNPGKDSVTSDLSVFLVTQDYSSSGIFDSNCYRIQIHLETVKQDPLHPYRYFVTGSDRLKNRVTPFKGVIEIEQIRVRKENFYGDIDSMNYVEISAHYRFAEDSAVSGSGGFSGKLSFALNKYRDWLIDDIYDWSGDSYVNFKYNGTWKSYKTGLVKPCIWGEGHFTRGTPFTDFDIGAGELSAGPKYRKNGWETNDDGSYKDDPPNWWKKR